MDNWKPMKLILFAAAAAAVATGYAKGAQGSGLRDALFPTAEVSLRNDWEADVLSMCRFDGYDRQFHVLEKGQKVTWRFRRVIFPTRWCYLYYSDSEHGFVWAYSLRYKCNPCIWSVRHKPHRFNSMSREDERQWLVYYLHPVPLQASPKPNLLLMN